jgi:hypothetical protein
MKPYSTPKAPLDWRYRTVTTLADDWKSPYTGRLHNAGSPVSRTTFVRHGDKQIQIGDPSAPALFLNSAWTAYLRSLAGNPFRPDAKPEKGKDPSRQTYDYLEDIMAAIVFSHTAIEAFANEEIPEDYEYPAQRRSGLLVVLRKASIEREVDLSEKLSTILPAVKKVPSPKGTKTWEDFVRLKRMRDRLVHMKSADRAASKDQNLFPDSIWSQLLAPVQPNYPLIAKQVIAIFKDPEETHWLKYCPIS